MTICTDCYREAVDPVELTDVDGATRVVCKLHTLTDEELIARVESLVGLWSANG